MEREAEAAENESKKVKLCELMAEHLDEVFLLKGFLEEQLHAQRT